MNKIEFDKIKEEIFKEVNKIRTNPKSYIPLLEKRLKWFKGKVLHNPAGYTENTEEGPKAIKEAIKYLKKQKPLESLNLDDTLSKAAQDHADELGTNGIMSHISLDGSSTSQRLKKYLEWNSCVSENIDCGRSNGEDIIISLVVDDGIPNRGHRENIFQPKSKTIGIGVAYHKVYEVISVMDFVGGISSYCLNIFNMANLTRNSLLRQSEIKKFEKRKNSIHGPNNPNQSQNQNENQNPLDKSPIGKSNYQRKNSTEKNQIGIDTHKKQKSNSTEKYEFGPYNQKRNSIKKYGFGMPTDSNKKKLNNSIEIFDYGKQEERNRNQKRNSIDKKQNRTQNSIEKNKGQDKDLIKFQIKKLPNLEKKDSDDEDADPDAPDGYLSCRIQKSKKKQGNKTIITINKIYKMPDGTEEIVTHKKTKLD